MARAILYQNGKFEFVKRSVPKAEPGHVIVHVTLRPVNPVDLSLIAMVAAQIGGPAVPGYEGCGIVHSVRSVSDNCLLDFVRIWVATCRFIKADVQE